MERFVKEKTFSTGSDSNPYAAAASDFNKDSRFDLVIAKEGTDTIDIIFGFNYTSFVNQESYSNIDSLKPTGIVVRDFNYDKFFILQSYFKTMIVLVSFLYMKMVLNRTV
jgi:hypothetical protein